MIKLDTKTRKAPFIVEYPGFDTMKALDGDAEVRKGISSLRGRFCLYLHIPFCRYRCHFCYYKVIAAPDDEIREKYVDALLSEIRDYGKRTSRMEVATIYFGGGTPTYLSGDEFERIYRCVEDNFQIADDVEFTVEVEPGTGSTEKFQALKAIGVTRVSIGAEHFDDTILRLNGRPHRASAVARCVDRARAIGFDNINIDLITGLLKDSLKVWPTTMTRLLELDPEYVSIYPLQVLPNMVLARTLGIPRGGAVVAREIETAIADFAYKSLEAHGYFPHASFSFAKNKAFIHKHRELAWTKYPMIGVGVSAYSTIPGVLFQNSSDFGHYLKFMGSDKSAVVRAHFLNNSETNMRSLVLAMKLGRVEFARLDPALRRFFEPEFDALTNRGLAFRVPSGIQLTRSGRLFADNIIEWLLSRDISSSRVAQTLRSSGGRRWASRPVGPS